MKAVIELEDMEFRACHGCYDMEKIVGNRFRVDLAITADVTEAAEYDELEKSINYLTVYELVRKEMAEPSNIIENVAKRIIDSVSSSFPSIEHISVKVAKIAPPLGGKIGQVSVTATRQISKPGLLIKS